MLTDARKQTLAAYLRAGTDPVLVAAMAVGDVAAIVNWCNSPNTFVVWRSSVTKNEVGKAFEASALAAITAGNNDKLSCFAAWNDTVFPNRADQRAFFDDIFSVAAGANTRAALLALWKRFASNAERAFVTGAGTNAVPGNLVLDGNVSQSDVSDALNRF